MEEVCLRKTRMEEGKSSAYLSRDSRIAEEKPKRNIKISRCGCEAMIGLKRQVDNKYEVVRFVQSHTHNNLFRQVRDISSSQIGK